MTCIHPTLEGWVYIMPIHGPLDGPLYTWAQYTATILSGYQMAIRELVIWLMEVVSFFLILVTICSPSEFNGSSDNRCHTVL